MFQNDYRREMDGLRPSPAAVERLNRLLEEGAPARRPRRLGRRAAAALALCAALCVTAVAAGPTLWDALEARLGPYAPFAAEVEGETSGQGLRLELVKAVSDGTGVLHPHRRDGRPAQRSHPRFWTVRGGRRGPYRKRRQPGGLLRR